MVLKSRSGFEVKYSDKGENIKCLGLVRIKAVRAKKTAENVFNLKLGNSATPETIKSN